MRPPHRQSRRRERVERAGARAMNRGGLGLPAWTATAPAKPPAPRRKRGNREQTNPGMRGLRRGSTQGQTTATHKVRSDGLPVVLASRPRLAVRIESQAQCPDESEEAVIRIAKCHTCNERRPCAVLNPDAGWCELRICQECVSLAYAEFLCAEAEEDGNAPTTGSGEGR
jgi:hypothetical protein